MKLVTYSPAFLGFNGYFLFADATRMVRVYVNAEGVQGLEAVQGDCDDCNAHDLMEIVKSELAFLCVSK